MICPRASRDTRAEQQCEPGDSLLAGVQPEDDLHKGGGCTDACQMWVGLESQVGGRSMSLLSQQEVGNSVKSYRGSDDINAGVKDSLREG